jgi:hypothetical protein
VINKRETAQDDRREGTLIGGLLGGVGAGLGIPGTVAICLGTGGWGCLIAGGLVAIDLGLAGFNLIKGADANNDLGEPNGLEDSAVNHFQQLRAENDPVEQRPP